MLREYQKDIKNGILAGWQAGHRNVLAVAPTGAGKTRIKAALLAECGVPACAIAHRQELVGQISMSLAREGVRHRLIAPRAIIASVIRQHIDGTGRNWCSPHADIGVAGVDTLIRAKPDNWFNRVQIWDIDEAHHVLPGNKWGKATELFPQAWGLGVTATPLRADRKSLGRETGGIFDHLVIGPSMRWLIDRKYLADYRIFVPPQSIRLDAVDLSAATGDYNIAKLRDASHKSTITGDIVRDYMRFAPNKLGITFVVDVETAGEVATAFQSQGVRAEAISANTPDHIRAELIARFGRGDIQQLVNVDLFGEGMDVPAVECISMGRPTQSYGLYVQQFGRGLRSHPGKTHGIIIDHVGNVVRHGLPDRERDWTLNDVERSRRARDRDDIPLSVCAACFQPYEAFRTRCPWCGERRQPAPGASRPEQVAGDLIELSPEILAAMRGEVDRVDGRPLIPFGATPAVQGAVVKRWTERQDMQRVLRDAINQWAGIAKYVDNLDDSEIYRKFWYTFGVDVMTAQTLGANEARELTERVRASCA